MAAYSQVAAEVLHLGVVHQVPALQTGAQETDLQTDLPAQVLQAEAQAQDSETEAVIHHLIDKGG